MAELTRSAVSRIAVVPVTAVFTAVVSAIVAAWSRQPQLPREGRV